MGADPRFRQVFVLMPFVAAGKRNEAQLTSFFENSIKQPIETASLKSRYQVRRSGQAFDITAEIIRDLCRADIVIADLSGIEPNPNVMYELGVRLAISDAPVILIRERDVHSKRVFDVYGFFTYEYDPFDYPPLEEHLIDKLRRLELGEEPYANPVLAIIRTELSRLNPDLTDVPAERQRELALRGVAAVATAAERAYGPSGMGLAIETPRGGLILARRGVEIARGMASANPFERAGINLMAEASSKTAAEFGDGTKLPVIVAHALIDALLDATSRGAAIKESLKGARDAVDTVLRTLAGLAQPLTDQHEAVADTASQGPLDLDIVAALRDAGVNGVVIVEEGGEGATMVEKVDHMVFDRGAVDPECVASCVKQECVMDQCHVLLCAFKITGMRELLPVLEQVARTRRPLLLVADDVEGEALALVLTNQKKGTLVCVPVRTPGGPERRAGLLQDLAVLTGATVLNPQLGGTLLENATLRHLGRAERVVVGVAHTEIIGGGGTPTAIQARVGALRTAQPNLSPYEADLITDRIARLAGVIVRVRVGGDSAQELHDKKYRAVSALRAVAAARGAGVIAGGGAAILHAARALDPRQAPDEAQRLGIHAAKVALERPIRALVAASGDDAQHIIDVLSDSANPTLGYDARSRKIGNLIEAGVLDPVQTVSAGVRTGLAAATTFLETGAWQIRETM